MTRRRVKGSEERNIVKAMGLARSGEKTSGDGGSGRGINARRGKAAQHSHCGRSGG